MLTALINGIIFNGEEFIFNKALLYGNGKVVELVEISKVPAHAVRIDCNGNYIAPGLIDLQIYGGGGKLFSEAPSTDSLKTIAEALLKTGTTGFLITLATNSLEIFDEAVQAISPVVGGNIMGLHFEGPYLNPLRRGAHPEKYIRTPELKEIESLLQRSGKSLRMMTIAPELFDENIIQLLVQHKVVLSAGHSNASYDEATQAFANGVTCATHLFNAMPPLHHRDPALCGAIFGTPGVHASIIADGIHVDYKMVAIAKKLLGEQLFLITDAVEEARTGLYTHVKHNDRFTLLDGTLSGSNITLFQAVQNCVEHVGIRLDEALRMASTYPAKAILSDDRGKILPGYRADFIIFTKNFSLEQVILEGQTSLNN